MRSVVLHVQNQGLWLNGKKRNNDPEDMFCLNKMASEAGNQDQSQHKRCLL